MAAQSPSTRDTNRISPEESCPIRWALAEGWEKAGVEAADTRIRVSADEEAAMDASHSRARG